MIAIVNDLHVESI